MSSAKEMGTARPSKILRSAWTHNYGKEGINVLFHLFGGILPLVSNKWALTMHLYNIETNPACHLTRSWNRCVKILTKWQSWRCFLGTCNVLRNCKVQKPFPKNVFGKVKIALVGSSSVEENIRIWWSPTISLQTLRGWTAVQRI